MTSDDGIISLDAMRARALMYKNLRGFFLDHHILEVETPALEVFQPLSQDCTTSALQVLLSDAEQFIKLRTSLRYAMQQLVNAGSGAIYQIGKAYRTDPLGRRHQLEFSILHWSQPAWSFEQSLLDLTTLFNAIFSDEVVPERRSYQQAFLQRLEFDINLLSTADLRLQARRLGLNVQLGEDRQAWLDLLFNHFIEPTLGLEMPLYLSDLPRTSDSSAHSELAQIYMDGIKVGNVIASPDCGEAETVSIVLGLDRLLMILLEVRHMAKVLSIHSKI